MSTVYLLKPFIFMWYLFAVSFDFVLYTLSLVCHAWKTLFFVILNSIFTSSRWLLIDNYDPAHQLQWLIDTLQEAEDNGEKVGFILERESSAFKTWVTCTAPHLLLVIHHIHQFSDEYLWLINQRMLCWLSHFLFVDLDDNQ